MRTLPARHWIARAGYVFTGVTVLSEVAQRLMMMSGSDASTFAAEYGRAATSRMNEVASTPSQRDIASPADRTRNLRANIRLAAAAPSRRMCHDAVKDDCDLSGDSDLCLPHTDPLGELHAPGLEGRPLLCPIEKYGGGLKQVGSEKPVAPSRYLAVDVSFARLVAPRCKAEVGADCQRRQWVIDRMAESQGGHHADTGNGY
ncbi:hypothetical protein ACVJDU_002773 [Bradyrhizobium diazoefficiens]